MPAERTHVTEITTGLGMVGDDDLASLIGRRPPEMSNLTSTNWDQLTALWDSGTYETDFTAGFLNGQAFLAAPDALNGRRPRIIEWTGDAGLRATRSYLPTSASTTSISSAASTSRGSFTTQAPPGC
jgi:hypothetical protein